MRVFESILGISFQERGAQPGRFFVAAQALVVWMAVFAAILLNGCSSGPAMEFKAGVHNVRTQQFFFQADKGHVIAGDQGAIFAIPPGAFIDEYGNNVTGNVELRLKEANRDIDILTGGLVTQAGDDMLASGGMYMIEAVQNGQQLALNPAVGIYAYLPARKKDAEMGLYKGAFNQSKLDWKLTGQKEGGVPRCDLNKFTEKQCVKCKKLLKMAGKIKPGKKPPKEEYWTKRHYWENGVLYFASSGSRKAVFSQEQIDECKEYLEGNEKGRELLGMVEQYKAEWKDRIGEYYSYKLQDLGWYNIDKLVKQEMISLRGKVLDKKGNPVAGAQVHLYCKDEDLKVHTWATAKDGSFEMTFVPGRQVLIYAYEKGCVAKTKHLVKAGTGQEVESLTLAQVEPGEVAAYLLDLM